MKKVIVTTTINPPTQAIERFQAMPDWDLVVIGDLKTPADYHLDRGVYVSPAEQAKYDRTCPMPSAGTAFSGATSACFGRMT